MGRYDKEQRRAERWATAARIFSWVFMVLAAFMVGLGVSMLVQGEPAGVMTLAIGVITGGNAYITRDSGRGFRDTADHYRRMSELVERAGF